MGFVTKNQGDVEVLQGIVTDYAATVQKDGSVNCSVTLTSKNSALLSFATDDDMIMNIKSILTRGILYLGLRAVVSSGDENDYDQDLAQLQSTPNANATSTDIETYNQNLLILARKELSGRSGPGGNAVRTGVFVENLNADNTYISWGLFEDLIINSQFGFGKNNQDIVSGKNFEVKMDSANQFTRWSKANREKQHVLMSVPEDTPAFVFPDWWGQFDDETPGSYSYQIDKLPKFSLYDEEGNLTSLKTYQNKEFSYKNDITIGRIPIREVFINVDMIVKAFESNSDVKKVLQEILNELNKESDGLFDWQMKQGKNDSEVEIIDVNYTIQTELDKTNINPDRNFVFNIQSPNSMVRDYNLEFKLPSGNIGNMYAIQGLGVGDTVFSTNPAVKNAIATGALDEESLQIIYEPDMGNHRAEQMLNEPKVDSETFNVFKQVDNLFDNNVYKAQTTEVSSIIDNFDVDTVKVPGTPFPIVVGVNSANLTNTVIETGDSESEPKLTAEDIMKTSNESLEAAGFKIAKTFKEYYKFKLTGEIEQQVPNLLPYSLNLTIFGISSIHVGDTFKVDYLPKSYQKSTYLQVIKVSHEIGPGGWYTALDTQFRIEPEKTNQITPDDKRNKLRLSPTAIANLPCEDKIEADAGIFSWGNDLKLADLAPYMTNLIIDYGIDWKFDFAIHFKMAKELEGELANESGYIKNSRGNFFADFPYEGKRNTALKSIDAGDWYSADGDGLGHSYYIELTNSKVWPPDFQLIPNHYYTMMVAGDKIGLLYIGDVEKGEKNEYYDNTYKFFQQYYGMNGKGLSEQVGELIEDASDTISNFFTQIFWD